MGQLYKDDFSEFFYRINCIDIQLKESLYIALKMERIFINRQLYTNI